MKRFCTILLLLLFVPLLRAVEYTPAQVPNVHQTDGRRFVSNPDGILSPETVDTLDRTLFGLQEATTSEVAVVALQSIGQADTDLFATELFTSAPATGWRGFYPMPSASASSRATSCLASGRATTTRA